MDKVGTCPLCGINVYDLKEKNRPFSDSRKRSLMGFPADKAMPCGIDRTNSEDKDEPKERCPFETKEEQDKIIIDLKKVGAIGKGSNYD